VLSWNIIAKTNGFKSIQTARKFACYAGVVPFEHQSGTSVWRKPKVSVYADKSLKSLLHMAAMSAIRLKNDLRAYYQRKVQDGKNKMLVLNAVRNKIIQRVYAVIKNQTPYKNSLELS
jgi:transposase